jgi:hypothetical protein
MLHVRSTNTGSQWDSTFGLKLLLKSKETESTRPNTTCNAAQRAPPEKLMQTMVEEATETCSEQSSIANFRCRNIPRRIEAAPP